jgi:hypothetical protein
MEATFPLKRLTFHWATLRYIPEERYCHCSFAVQTRMHNVYMVENLEIQSKFQHSSSRQGKVVPALNYLSIMP